MRGTIWFINGLYVGARVMPGADREASPQLNETDTSPRLYFLETSRVKSQKCAFQLIINQSQWVHNYVIGVAA